MLLGIRGLEKLQHFCRENDRPISQEGAIHERHAPQTVEPLGSNCRAPLGTFGLFGSQAPSAGMS